MEAAAKYLRLAERYRQAAEQATNPSSRQQLQVIAHTHTTLADSAGLLQRSGKVLELLNIYPPSAHS